LGGNKPAGQSGSPSLAQNPKLLNVIDKPKRKKTTTLTSNKTITEHQSAHLFFIDLFMIIR